MKKTYRSDDGTAFTHEERASRIWLPMKLIRDDDSGLGETWGNDWYYCLVRRFKHGFFIKNSKYAIISISNINESAQHDWRDFQRIKNDVVGTDWEAIELYPSETRLKDPSNRFYLWAVPLGILNYGLPGDRKVVDMPDSIAPQRPFYERKEGY